MRISEVDVNGKKERTTEKIAHQDILNTTAGIAVKDDEGVLVVSAEKNIALAGATLSALGKNGSVLSLQTRTSPLTQRDSIARRI